MIADTIIAGSAVALTLYTINATHRHNRLSVTPHLTGHDSRNATNEGVTFTCDIRNSGLGPARIKSFTLFLDGKPFTTPDDNPVEAIFKELLNGKAQYVLKRTWWARKNRNGLSLIAGQSVSFCEVFFPALTKADEEKVNDLAKRMALRIEYESFYGEHFVFESEHLTAKLG